MSIKLSKEEKNDLNSLILEVKRSKNLADLTRDKKRQKQTARWLDILNRIQHDSQ